MCIRDSPGTLDEPEIHARLCEALGVVGEDDYAPLRAALGLSLIHISEPTRLLSISYAVFCLKKKKKNRVSSHSQIYLQKLSGTISAKSETTQTTHNTHPRT